MKRHAWLVSCLALLAAGPCEDDPFWEEWSATEIQPGVYEIR